MEQEVYCKRRQLVRERLMVCECDAMLITNPVNVRYLTGFRCEDSYLYLTLDSELLLSDARFQEQIAEEAPNIELWMRAPGAPMVPATCAYLSKMHRGRLAVEASHMTVAHYDAIGRALAQHELFKSVGIVESQRQRKDSHEIALIRRAVEVAERSLIAALEAIDRQTTEVDFAMELERQVRRHGATGCSFPPIVAAGARASLPHASPSDRKTLSEAFLLVDWGATVDGYRSDLTRVVTKGPTTAQFAEVHAVVLGAQRAAIDSIRPGALIRDIDSAARNFIADAGYGDRFQHGLGHGIGLDIHELPWLGATYEGVLEPGMVITIEPGIYLPGWGGIRIEDDILVTASGAEVLSQLPRDCGAISMPDS